MKAIKRLALVRMRFLQNNNVEISFKIVMLKKYVVQKPEISESAKLKKNDWFPWAMTKMCAEK